MILLLDAHAFLWWARDEELLPDARAAISDPANDIIVSAATVWELEIKRAQGKLTAPADLLEIIDAEGFTCLPVSGADAAAAARLPVHHRDPFDRMLVAQATRLDAVVVTRDSAFRAYDLEVLPA
ncbi:MAG: type II toxin-antitoxin system VapC family toxin [Chloroflexota bacterium]